MFKSLKFFLFTLSMFTLNTLHAKTEDILASLTADMAHYNHVATVTKENEPYQPYIISVFKGKVLERLGIADLKEALELVPGVDMATDNINTQTPIFRGSNSHAFGQTKLFIDGVLVNNVFFDAYSEYLSLPIEMIKRIEVVRGPGSKTNGVNAYAGSINVITYAENFDKRSNKTMTVIKGGSYDYKMGGFYKMYKNKDFQAFVDFSFQEDDKKLPAGLDGYAQGSMSSSALGIDNTGLATSGLAPVWLQSYALGINLHYKDLTFKSRLLDYTEGNAYGINYALPEDVGRVKLPSYYAEVGYLQKFKDLSVDIKAGVKVDAFDSYDKLGHNGIQFIDMVTFDSNGSIYPVTFTNGIYGEHLARQRTIYQSSYLKYFGWDQHIVTSGYRVFREETTAMVSKLSNWSTGDAALVDYTTIYPFFNKNAKRDTFIASLQDEYSYSEHLSFIYGFNYEQTSYKNAGIEPRISMVYQLDRFNIIKAMYSRAHRNPSWQEMFTMNNHSRQGSTDLDPETVDALETAYIKKFSNDSYMQANLFYLNNQNQIYNSQDDPAYRNVLDTQLYGMEFEYKKSLGAWGELYFNYAYVDGTAYVKDADRYESVPDIAHHLAKGYYLHHISDMVSFSTVLKYVGSKSRAYNDTRADLPDYLTTDISIQYHNYHNKFSIALSVKNLFDEKVLYPSTVKTYVDDYQQEGRNYLLTLKKAF